jgi:hypothetical protein
MTIKEDNVIGATGDLSVVQPPWYHDWRAALIYDEDTGLYEFIQEHRQRWRDTETDTTVYPWIPLQDVVTFVDKTEGIEYYLQVVKRYQSDGYQNPPQTIAQEKAYLEEIAKRGDIMEHSFKQPATKMRSYVKAGDIVTLRIREFSARKSFYLDKGRGDNFEGGDVYATQELAMKQFRSEAERLIADGYSMEGQDPNLLTFINDKGVEFSIDASATRKLQAKVLSEKSGVKVSESGLSAVINGKQKTHKGLSLKKRVM